MRRLTGIGLVIIVASLVFQTTRAAHAGIINVGASRTYTSIASAINAASNGDTILVDDGLYQENLNVNKSVTIQAVNVGGASIDGRHLTAAVIDVRPGANATIQGFLIANGRWAINADSGGNYTAIRDIAVNTESAFTVQTSGARIGNATVLNSIVYGASGGFGINDGDTIHVKNSIIMNTPTAYGNHNGNGIYPDHNLLFNVNVVKAYGPTPGPIYDDPSQIIADPLFVDAAHWDFHLRAGSPAIDAGLDVGFPFLGSGPDIGVFEYAPAQDVPEPSSLALLVSMIAAGPLLYWFRRR